MLGTLKKSPGFLPGAKRLSIISEAWKIAAKKAFSLVLLGPNPARPVGIVALLVASSNFPLPKFWES